MAHSKNMKIEDIARLLEEEDDENVYDDDLDNMASDVDDEVEDADFCAEVYSDSDSEILETESEEEMDTNINIDEAQDFENCEVQENNVEPNNNTSQKSYYYGRNRFKWSAHQPTRFTRTPLHNIVRLPTSVGSQNNEDDSEGMIHRYWSKFFDESIEDIIIEHTNKKL